MESFGLRSIVVALAVFALTAPSDASASTEIVVVDETFWDAFYSGMNPGCPGCGLRDWDDVYFSAWACRRLPSGTRGTLCGGSSNVMNGSDSIQSQVTTRWDGLVTEFNDPSDDWPPYDPNVSGAIQSFTATYRLRYTAHNGPVTNSIEGYVLIRQGGQYFISNHFVAASSSGGEGSWVDVGRGGGGDPLDFEADDFGKILVDESIDMGQNPDFSSTAAPLYFGFALDMSYQGPLGGLPGNPFLNRLFQIDDVHVVVTTAPPPAPAPSLPPIALGALALLLGLAAARRSVR